MHFGGHDTDLTMAKPPERPTVKFYSLDAYLLTPKQKVVKRHHETMNSLLLTECQDEDEEIEDSKSQASTWLDDVRESIKAPEDADFDLESKIDLSAKGLHVVLAEEAEAICGDKGDTKAEKSGQECDSSSSGDSKWPETW
ncbi:hypothetical protein SERLADRAFT_433066 [Serpula lacrymans var. lacrymans S7.9]|uniref:Uncharacterized protein n=1 Tax=Serpula lacrymans var. lacrymans (strain S7.9) TaxID=578457 RepID=F8NGC0_SERL9|nr:uncharacterized protein SERLADRAFT_433066 [Serpula lacrymans var. lacrymans S7.9]EGO29055.1 hypothetical protein SERLADRAFT_433066 [Serpula lacrymans var. lacrymans S7.9]